MSRIRVSVLLPARDAEATLAGCLRSLQRQTETRWECVLVDDASRDGTRSIAEGFARRDARVRVVSGPGSGIVDALRQGLAECQAPLVARMDADDWMHRDRLRAQAELLDERPELSGVGCHTRIFPRAGLQDGRRRYEGWLASIRGPADVRRDQYVECPLAHPTWMIRTEALRTHPYRDCGWPEDYDLLLRMLGAGCELGVVPQRLLGWRDDPARLSRNDPRYAEARFTACKAEHLAQGFLADHAHYVLWGYGGTGRALRRELASRGRHPSYIVELHPRRIGQRIHGAPVIEPAALRKLRDLPIIASVSGLRPRGEIRAALDAMGFRELIDYVCAA